MFVSNSLKNHLSVYKVYKGGEMLNVIWLIYKETLCLIFISMLYLQRLEYHSNTFVQNLEREIKF